MKIEKLIGFAQTRDQEQLSIPLFKFTKLPELTKLEFVNLFIKFLFPIVLSEI